MVATSQRFSETHPDTEITWDKRSLQEFADYPIQKLAEIFDLLVIDHPFVGYAATHPVLLPLDEWMDGDDLADLRQNSAGESFRSYDYGGHLWALPIDAATPVSSWRADLLERAGASVPDTWEEVVALAQRGLVVFPSVPVDSLMNFYMLCCALGGAPFSKDDALIEDVAGAEALNMLRELAALCPPEIYSWNPVTTYEATTCRDDFAYCPFAYGYSNYAREGYAAHVLEFGDLCRIGQGGRARSTLGGTGLAISARSAHQECALEYARYVASPECQRTLYYQSGGQPAHRSAWQDPDVNRLTNNFFRNTLPAMERAYVRPRYNGYIDFQNRGGPMVHEFLVRGGDPGVVMRALRDLHQASLRGSG